LGFGSIPTLHPKNNKEKDTKTNMLIATTEINVFKRLAGRCSCLFSRRALAVDDRPPPLPPRLADELGLAVIDRLNRRLSVVPEAPEPSDWVFLRE
jgi:hypothetical protein